MTEHNNASSSNSTQITIQKWVIAVIMIIAAVLSLYYSMQHYSDGGCDGGLCGLLLIFHAAPVLAAWIFTLLSFATLKTARIASMGLLAIAAIINAVVLFMDYGRHLEELKVPVFILFVSQAYIFFQWLTVAPKQAESVSEKDAD